MPIILNGTTGLTFNDLSTQNTGYGGAGMSVATYTAASNSVGTPLVWNSNGNLTFTVPAGTTRLKVTVVGGGGSGGAGSGGGGGGAAIEFISGLTPGQTVAVTVGNTGGTSSFGAFCSATGGSTPSVTDYGGEGGVGTGGQLNIKGGGGMPSYVGPVQNGINGGGGSSILGGGAQSDANPINGGVYGGGGNAGGSGATGVVIIEWG